MGCEAIDKYRSRRDARLSARRRDSIAAYYARRDARLKEMGLSPVPNRATLAGSALNAKNNRANAGKNGIINSGNRLDANPDGSQWVTLENGRRIFIDKDGNIKKGFGAGGNVKELGQNIKSLKTEARYTEHRSAQLRATRTKPAYRTRKTNADGQRSSRKSKQL